jgi:hypothetical protein
LLASCGAGERSFRQIQFCLNGQNDIQALKATVQAIARSEEMDFTDRSADAESELESIRKDMPHVRVAHPTIVLDAHRRDGLGFGGMNFGDAPLQFAFGFSKGRNETEARQFAEKVVQLLSTKWIIHEVPEDRGAFPLKKCDYVVPNA